MVYHIVEDLGDYSVENNHLLRVLWSLAIFVKELDRSIEEGLPNRLCFRLNAGLDCCGKDASDE
jgi:hypothetical protein